MPRAYRVIDVCQITYGLGRNLVADQFCGLRETGWTYTQATRPKLGFRSGACASQNAETSFLRLSFESRTVAPPVSSWGLLASHIDFLCMKAKAFRLHKTEGANNHIEQGDPLFFAHHPIGVTNDRLPAMLTNAIHDLRFRGKEYAMPTIMYERRRKHCVSTRFWFSTEKEP